MERLVSLVLLAACGGSVELGAPNTPPEWPMGSVVAHSPAPSSNGGEAPVDAAPTDTDVPTGPEPSAEPAPPVTEPPAPVPDTPPAEEPPETE
jgi:hypothetical protein